VQEKSGPLSDHIIPQPPKGGFALNYFELLFKFEQRMISANTASLCFKLYHLKINNRIPNFLNVFSLYVVILNSFLW
jgi:hypothetical protein